ncbi:MAG TPA: FISUMP domain-containing protein [Chitinophagales bacterium]|nr:FISUMP domain-containing protein [Chitinophagales bacterium]
MSIWSCKKDNPKIINNPVKIKARFEADQTNLKQGDVVNFTDSTTGFPLTWTWTFEGGTPSTSSVQNPKGIKYNSLGEFNVTLVVTNAYGKDSIVKKSYIKVLRELFVPTIETLNVLEISGLNYKVGGSLLDTGSAAILEMGICWDTIENPDINNTRVKTNFLELGDFFVQLKGLEENKNYNYRAYAINEDGVGYGKQFSIKTPQIDSCDFWKDKFEDPRDGNVYRSIQVAGKTWMGDNLNYELDNSWCYNNQEANCDKFGRLYSIEAAKEACPVGWRLPSDQEWNSLINSLGANPALKMMKKGAWNIAPASNSFCFSAYPGGYKSIETGVYSTLNYFGYWWTNSKNSEGLNLSKNISYDNNSVLTIGYDNNIALSVRCIKN